MSGLDEKPKEEVLEADPLICDSCGGMMWIRYYTEVGYARYFADINTLDWRSQQDFEWDDGLGWICENCGAGASVEVCERIDELY